MRSLVLALALAAGLAPAAVTACPFGKSAETKAPQTVLDQTGDKTPSADKKG